MAPSPQKILVRLILGCLLIVGIAAGCANKREAEKSRSDIDRAVYLIDQGQFSEAIYALTEKLKEEPEHVHARLLLASAYAGRAGLKFLDFKLFASQVTSWNGHDDPKLFSSKNKILQSVAQTIWQVQRFSQAFETVPAPTSKTGIDDIRKGLAILDDAGRLQDGPSLYRALLRVVVFKYDIVSRYDLIPQGGCAIDIPQLMRWFTDVGNELELMMTDYAYSIRNPDQRAKTLKSVGAIQKTAQDAQKLLAGAQGVPAMNIIQESIVQGATCGP